MCLIQLLRSPRTNTLPLQPVVHTHTHAHTRARTHAHAHTHTHRSHSDTPVVRGYLRVIKTGSQPRAICTLTSNICSMLRNRAVQVHSLPTPLACTTCLCLYTCTCTCTRRMLSIFGERERPNYKYRYMYVECVLLESGFILCAHDISRLVDFFHA